MKLKAITGMILCGVFASCNIIGDKIKEIPLGVGQIASTENIRLKKGDEIVFWSKVAAEYDEGYPNFTLKYLIQKDGVPVNFDSLKIMQGKHRINSSYDKDNGGRVDWQFEIENDRINIAEDGLYSFDFKLYEIEDDFPHDDVSIILRKK